MTTEPLAAASGADAGRGGERRAAGRSGRAGTVQRYNRRTRWFHAAVYLVTTAVLFTGWWLWRGSEGDPSVLADLLDLADVEIHRRAGWVLTGVLGVGVTLGVRGAWSFVRETLRLDRGDGRWFVRWPLGALTRRFAPHQGHFDPGQRLANLAFVATLGTAIGSGIGLTTVKAGPTFATLVRVHRYATYALVPLVVGHLVLATGLLPGYRGVWRSMHWRGRVPLVTARRLWPSRTANAPDTPADEPGSGDADPGLV